MSTTSKRHRENAKRVNPEQRYELKAAVALLKSMAKAKFDETVELSFKLGVDPKKQDQNLRGAVSMPKGTGKSARVICFAEGPAAQAAKDAGAIEVGSAELVKKIEEGWTDFDVAIASPDMMRHVGKLGKILGPQGKMPAPKAGTVTQDVATAVKEFAAGKVEFRTDPAGNIHVVVGKRSFAESDLERNVEFMLAYIKNLRPASLKGDFIRRVTLSSTMSPGIALAVE